jgi:hypothetical protein
MLKLRPDTELYIQNFIDKGHGHDADEVILKALRFLKAAEPIFESQNPTSDDKPDMYGYMKGTVKVLGDIVNTPNVWENDGEN